MQIIDMLLKEMGHEAHTTQKMLSRIPDDQYKWQPHGKSMVMQSLATHIAELPTWLTMILNTNELDFAAVPYAPTIITNTKDLIDLFEKSLADGRSSLEKATEADLEPTWSLRNGEEIYLTATKGEWIRTTYCQIVHHRAQLGVYLRLLDIPIPGSYGPSADDMRFN